MCVFAIERNMTRVNKKSIYSYVEFSQKDDKLGFISKFYILYDFEMKKINIFVRKNRQNLIIYCFKMYKCLKIH